MVAQCFICRSVCEALVSSDQLTPSRVDSWKQTFSLVRRVVGGVDYKGCRDLLRAMLEKTLTIPTTDNVSSLQLLEAVNQVFIYYV